MKMMKDKMDESPAEEAGESKDYEQHEIEDAAHTLTKAEEIKANPKLHGHAMNHLAMKQGHMKAAMGKPIGSLDELKGVIKNKQKAAMMEE